MALTSRNSLLTLFFIIGWCLIAVYVINASVFLILLALGGHINFFESHPFWFVYDLTAGGYVSSFIGVALLAVIGFVFFHLMRVFFKKTGQAEIFFFTLFLFSLSAETLRLGVLNLQLVNLPAFLGVFLSRVVFGSRIFGLLCLFFGSLYALDFQYQKFEIVVAVMVLVSFLLSFVIPFDSQVLLTNGLFKLSDEQGLFVLYSCLAVFLIVDYVITLLRGRLFAVFAGITCLLLAREMLVLALTPLVLVAGGVVFIGGFVLAYKGYESHYNIA